MSRSKPSSRSATRLGFPVDGVELTLLLVVADVERSLRFHTEVLAEPVDRGGEIRALFRDPDGHLLEISEVT